jgi:hypothetical protein
MANWVWLDIVDESSAREATCMASDLIAALCLLSLLAVFASAGPVSLLGAALFGLVAWRVRKGSRAWAVAGLVLYSLKLLFVGASMFSLIPLFVLLNGVRSTFAFRKYTAWSKQMLVPSP